MTARPDLETVKAMLSNALDGCPDGALVPVGSTIRVGTNLEGEPVPSKFALTAQGEKYPTFYIDADKLAATVLEWFAAHYERSSGEKMLAMIRQGGDA